MRVNSAETIKNIARALRQAFKFADCPEEIEPVFREAAEGDGDSGGVKIKGRAPIGLPSPKFHAMTGQSENTHAVRRSRIDGKNYRNKVIGRADYYADFDKVNSLKM